MSANICSSQGKDGKPVSKPTAGLPITDRVRDRWSTWSDSSGSDADDTVNHHSEALPMPEHVEDVGCGHSTKVHEDSIPLTDPLPDSWSDLDDTAQDHADLLPRAEHDPLEDDPTVWSLSDGIAQHHAGSDASVSPCVVCDSGQAIDTRGGSGDESDPSEDMDAFDEQPLRGRFKKEGFNIVFLLDASGSMRECDVQTDSGSLERRIDAAMRACRVFLQQRIVESCPGSANSALGASRHDVYSVALFADEVQWFFLHQHAQRALILLQEIRNDAVPFGGTQYQIALQSVDQTTMNDQDMKIIFLSDGRPADWHQKTLNWFQFKWLKQFPPGALQFNCIGFGPNSSEFRVLQQMAMLGQGVSKLSGFRISELQDSFTFISKCFTSMSWSKAQGKERISQKSKIEFMPPDLLRVISTKDYMRRSSFSTKWALLTILKEIDAGKLNSVVATSLASGVKFKGKEIRGIPDFEFPVTVTLVSIPRTCEELECIRCHYKWSPEKCDVIPVGQLHVTVWRALKPFTQGGMRVAYEMFDFEGCAIELDEKPLHMVAKKSKWISQYARLSSRLEQMKYVKSACLAAYYADLFSSLTLKTVTALPCYLYSRKVPEEDFCGEDFVPGFFVKWISNNGDIFHAAGVDVASALAHFSWWHSKGRYMVADIQGVVNGESYVIFDPQILSTDKSFGPADFGSAGMLNFFRSHRCNALCKILGLAFRMQNEEATASQLEQVLLLQFGSPPRSGSNGLAKFRELLMQGTELRHCREAMTAAGHHWLLKGGALMFAKPHQIEQIHCAIADLQLCGYHVIVTESLEHLVTEVLASMPFKMRPKERKCAKGRHHLFGICSRADLVCDRGGLADVLLLNVVQVVDRSFITLKPRPRPSHSVTQSTTEVVGAHGYYSYHRGINPRRLV